MTPPLMALLMALTKRMGICIRTRAAREADAEEPPRAFARVAARREHDDQGEREAERRVVDGQGRPRHRGERGRQQRLGRGGAADALRRGVRAPLHRRTALCFCHCLVARPRRTDGSTHGATVDRAAARVWHVLVDDRGAREGQHVACATLARRAVPSPKWCRGRRGVCRWPNRAREAGRWRAAPSRPSPSTATRTSPWSSARRPPAPSRAESARKRRRELESSAARARTRPLFGARETLDECLMNAR